jgi:hypothetical protein
MAVRMHPGGGMVDAWDLKSVNHFLFSVRANQPKRRNTHVFQKFVCASRISEELRLCPLYAHFEILQGVERTKRTFCWPHLYRHCYQALVLGPGGGIGRRGRLKIDLP